MLTKALLSYRIHRGKVRPSFIDVESSELTELARHLIAIADAGVDGMRGEVEEAMGVQAKAGRRVRVAKGLVKLLSDRMTFEEPGEESLALREKAFQASAEVLRSLGDDAAPSDYEKRLDAILPGGIALTREALYADLSERRVLLSWKRLTPRELLDRYNLAQAQGLLIYAHRLTVSSPSPGLLELRRVLRWLKFCRLVADVRHRGDAWTFDIEGPGAILSMHKKYGLQLASFLPVVPLLGKFTLRAQIEVPRRAAAVLELSERDPLVSTHQKGLGHVPEEISHVLGRLEGGDWEVELVPAPRHVGATGMCVPDLSLTHPERGVSVAIELFHPWHHGLLGRRLDELATRPDPYLFLGVDRALYARDELKERLETAEQVFTFNKFPSERRIKAILQRFDP